MTATPWQDEHDAAVAQKAKRYRKGWQPPSAFRGPWSPVQPDPAGGWWLYGDHYDTREAAEEARHARAS